MIDKKLITPTDQQLRALVAVFMSEVVTFIMSNHVYLVGDQVFLQENGAPIGLEVAQLIGRINMIDHDQQVMKDLENPLWQLSLRLHDRFEDNQDNFDRHTN